MAATTHLVLGALTITSEYATGGGPHLTDRAATTGNPVRSQGCGFRGVSLVTGLVASFASFFIGQAILSSDPGSHLFSAWTGFGVFAAYAAIAIAAGLILFRKRDA